MPRETVQGAQHWTHLESGYHTTSPIYREEGPSVPLAFHQRPGESCVGGHLLDNLICPCTSLRMLGRIYSRSICSFLSEITVSVLGIEGYFIHVSL